MPNQLDIDYQNLLDDILSHGVRKEDRTGTGTLSVFGRTLRHKMSNGFPVLTTKKIHFPAVVSELLWFLRGQTNIKHLLEEDCNIWNGDCYKAYTKAILKEGTTDSPLHVGDCEYTPVTGTVLEDIGSKFDLIGIPFEKKKFIERIKSDDEFAKKWGELGPIYGKQWRSWNLRIDTNNPKIQNKAYSLTIKDSIDQITNLINELKTNPDSRRLMVNSWNLEELDQMVLPPCHYGFQVYTRELSYKERNELYKERIGEYVEDTDARWEMSTSKTFIDDLNDQNIPSRAISLSWNQRSVDTFLGLPFNIASYGLLLHIIAETAGMVPEELIGNLGDTHIYLDHIKQSRIQIDRIPYDLPELEMDHEPFLDFSFACHQDPNTDIDHLFFNLNKSHFSLKGYQSYPAIKAPLSN